MYIRTEKTQRRYSLARWPKTRMERPRKGGEGCSAVSLVASAARWKLWVPQWVGFLPPRQDGSPHFRVCLIKQDISASLQALRRDPFQSFRFFPPFLALFPPSPAFFHHSPPNSFNSWPAFPRVRFLNDDFFLRYIFFSFFTSSLSSPRFLFFFCFKSYLNSASSAPSNLA